MARWSVGIAVAAALAVVCLPQADARTVDEFSCNGARATIIGTSQGDDRVNGGAGTDTVGAD